MAWTTPITAVANAAFTAAQFNASVRDNLLTTAPALATTAGRFFASTGANAIAERIPTALQNSTADTTTATNYGALSGGSGPAVTVTSGPSVLVCWGALVQNSSANVNTFASFAISGANTVASSDTFCVGGSQSTGGGQGQSSSRVYLATGLTPGSSSFTMQYRVSSGTGTFSNRHIAVLPF